MSQEHFENATLGSHIGHGFRCICSGCHRLLQYRMWPALRSTVPQIFNAHTTCAAAARLSASCVSRFLTVTSDLLSDEASVTMDGIAMATEANTSLSARQSWQSDMRQKEGQSHSISGRQRSGPPLGVPLPAAREDIGASGHADQLHCHDS
ncbi:hypothetical protein BDZ90DRAFT_127217 [Jaminaea rosea]|uniref:Uncharacterized protein n=1 Tax=Jaminaea rosea TaxID=1569628 RepID=A0A316UMD7_9BASI|nr:hypothetical protein BDZ90DRAFT_127217 [Jaminaea rosea]PWN24335.1 hypothetical protein BDZ90DRAFT_127217 [Jaminaea rosea]